MNEIIGGNLPPGHDALLFSISGTGYAHTVAYMQDNGPLGEVKVLRHEI